MNALVLIAGIAIGAVSWNAPAPTQTAWYLYAGKPFWTQSNEYATWTKCREALYVTMNAFANRPGYLLEAKCEVTKK
jgi:hypothetical protein